MKTQRTKEGKFITHHVIIDERMSNNLRVVDLEEYKMNEDTVVSVCSGSEEECNRFHSHYDEHVFYPMVELEELY